MVKILRVTKPKPRPFSEILFVHFREIVHVHPYAKFDDCSFNHFGDMFEGVPNIRGTPWKNPWTDIHETCGQLLPSQALRSAIFGAKQRLAVFTEIR